MTSQARDHEIVQDMLRYAPAPQIDQPARAANLDSWGLPRAAGDLLLNDPNAFLLGCLFNYRWPYAKALSAPLELSSRLGHLDVMLLAEMPWQHLAPYIRRGQHGPSLHRYPNNVARRVVSASRKLVAEYGGTAANIWPSGGRADAVIRRLRQFEGISQKISNMMANMLVTSFGVYLTGWEGIDVAVDRHVARVFLRTGLVPRDDGSYTAAEVANEVIEAVRALFPAFPGHLDAASFSIGLDWCRADGAYCDWGGEGGPCPLRESCRRRTSVQVCESPPAGSPRPCPTR